MYLTYLSIYIMAKFDLKKAILENKATFFGSLTEGQFSWMTQDTGQQIGSQDENMIPVYMFDDKGKYYYENDYEGYGVFGGMDYYELLDQMNGGSGDRSKGIDLAFDKSKEGSLDDCITSIPRARIMGSVNVFNIFINIYYGKI